MKPSPFVTGIDLQSDRAAVATVDTSLAKPEIYELNFSTSVTLEKGVCVALVLPDDQYIAKSMYTDGATPELQRKCCEFELSQSLLEKVEEFGFDVILSGSNRCLGVIYRRDRATALQTSMAGLHGATSTFRGRAVALGLGYLSYCRKSAESLVCLADFSAGAVSICLLHEHQIATIGHVVFNLSQPLTPSQARTLAIEMKTIVNFRLLSLSDRGITVPLSGLKLSGLPADETLLAALREYFPMGVALAEPDFTRFDLSPDISASSVVQHLVPLGLTVNTLASV